MNRRLGSILRPPVSCGEREYWGVRLKIPGGNSDRGSGDLRVLRRENQLPERSGLSGKELPLKKTRHTRQRKVILDILRSDPVHLTAEEIYQRARKALPGISLGTVYRNLNFLCGEELAWEVRNGDSGSARFEAARTPHAHFLCRGCQEIRDIPFPDLLRETRWENMGPIAAVSRLELQVVGHCPGCKPES
jgi:Fur family ferric uptake transcriptional regulator/Fur family peroxide stress response transcriptional regulator